MPTFAQPTPDENLVSGWTNQGNTGSPGYAQAAPVPVTTVVGQASAGYPNPPGAENINTENSGAYTSSVLTNGSYSNTPTTNLSVTPATAPIPGLTAAQSPYGLNSTATLVIPSGVTAVYYTPFAPTAPSGTSAPWVEVPATYGTSQTLVFSVPPAGWVKTTGAAATSVTYVPTN